MAKASVNKDKKEVGGVAPKKETKPKKGEVEEITVDEAYLEAHPELVEEGVAVGDVIEVPVMPKVTDSKLNLNKEVSILKGDEYIRTYPAGMEAEVEGFLSKDGKYVAVSPEKIVSITVSWRENVLRKDEDSGRMIDTGRMVTKSQMFTETTHGADWKTLARENANSAPKRACIAVIK